MQFGKKDIAQFAAIVILSFAAMLLLSQALSPEDLFRLDLGLIGKFTSTEFIAFVLLAPIPAAVAALSAKGSDWKKPALVSAVATAIGLGAGLAVFPSLGLFVFIALFYIAGIVWLSWSANTYFKEMKSMVTLRAVYSAAKKPVQLIAIGFLATSFLYVVPQQEKFISGFEKAIMESVESDALGGGKLSELGDSFVESHVESQKQLMAQLMDNELYGAVESSQDFEDIAFSALMDKTRETIEGPEYEERLKEEFKEQGAGRIQDISIMDQVKGVFPWFGLLEQFLWLIYGLALMGLFSMLGGIVLAPLAGVYGVVLDKAGILAKEEQLKKGQEAPGKVNKKQN